MWRTAALISLLVALVGPWFTWHDVSHPDRDYERWGLLYEQHCSDWSPQCRWSNANDETARLLLPLFVATRIAALATVVLLLLAVLLRHPRTRALSLAALVLFAVHIAAMPGDEQYKEYVPSLAALAALAGALAAFIDTLGWSTLAHERRRAVVFATAAGCYGLLAALWLPWAHQVEALAPSDPREQSAYSFDLLRKAHHWHDLRHSNEHYLEDGLWRPDDGDDLWGYGSRNRGGFNADALRDVRWLELLACALGLLFAGLSLVAAHHADPSRAWAVRVSAGGVFLALGLFVWFREATGYWHAVVPGSAVFAAVAALILNRLLGKKLGAATPRSAAP